MTMKNVDKQANEGEGNRTAARAFNQMQEAFAKSGKVAGKSREAAAAIDGAEGPELARAEAIGAAGQAKATAGTDHGKRIAPL
jgi:hypothetical protein